MNGYTAFVWIVGICVGLPIVAVAVIGVAFALSTGCGL